jgi:hypothetical protein
MDIKKLAKLPLTFSEFRDLREGHYLYVDKTRHAYTMITSGDKYFFFARPRRFGKSLFVSTLKEILEGNQELFQGLWIGNSDYKWQKHGVIKIDISSLGIKNAASFANGIRTTLLEVAKNYSLDVSMEYDSPELLLRSTVRALHERFGHVALLIDEYDHAILHALNDSERAREIRDSLALFFATIKGLGQYLKFVFITGVSSFVRAGLFSGINNLRIITLDEQYAEVCGYTDEEIDHNFPAYIEAWTETENLPYEDMRSKIKEWYNGYRFGVPAKARAVYNPFSLMYALEKQKFKDFWSQSATPTFLVEELKKEYRLKEYRALNVEHFKASETLLGAFEIGATPIETLLFQTGYLTITAYDRASDLFTLGSPNFEIKTSLQRYLFAAFAQLDFASARSMSEKLIHALQTIDIEQFVLLLKQLFAHVPSILHMKEEKYYHSLLQMAFTTADINAQSELLTADGRIDLVLHVTQNLVYIIELKYGKDAESALEQIEHKKYYERFAPHGDKQLILLGLSFKREPGHFDISYEVKRYPDQ